MQFYRISHLGKTWIHYSPHVLTVYVKSIGIVPLLFMSTSVQNGGVQHLTNGLTSGIMSVLTPVKERPVNASAKEFTKPNESMPIIDLSRTTITPLHSAGDSLGYVATFTAVGFCCTWLNGICGVGRIVQQSNKAVLVVVMNKVNLILSRGSMRKRHVAFPFVKLCPQIYRSWDTVVLPLSKPVQSPSQAHHLAWTEVKLATCCYALLISQRKQRVLCDRRLPCVASKHLFLKNLLLSESALPFSM